MFRRSMLVSVFVWVAVTATVEATLNCSRCSCGRQGSVFSLQCQLTGAEDVLMDGPGPLDFSSRTLYMRVENAASLYVGKGFLDALRRYYSVAVDLWEIGNLTFATDFRPKSRFLFMGMGIVNCSLPELPQGVISHSNAIGLRLYGSSVGVIRRGAFAQVQKVRYIQLTGSHLGTVEGPEMGRLQLSHRQDVHHGSAGLQVHDCSIDVLQEGALRVDMQADDEFVEIADTTISELGPGGLSVSGIGSVTVNHTVFGYLSTGALDISARGGIALLNSRVSSAAPAPLWRVRGGNGTRLDNVTFCQPASASLVLLEVPTGEEQLSGLRFSCADGRGRLQPGWTATPAGRRTMPDGLRRYLQRVEEAAECHPAGEVNPQTAASSLRPSGGAALFSSPAQVGVELLILALAAAATMTIVAVVVAVRRRRQRPTEAMADTQVLVEEIDVSEG